MKSWRPTLDKLFKALELANISSLRQLESALDERADQAMATPHRPTDRRVSQTRRISRKTHNGVTLGLVGHHR
jgi:hypothetical protein